MEQLTVFEVKCPRCGSSGKARARRCIDGRADQKGRRDLLAGRLNLFRCRGCSFTDSLPVDVFYYDLEKQFCVQYAPRWRTREDGFLDRLDDRAQPAFFEPGAGQNAPACLRDVHLVLTMGELAAYVAFRERLWKRRAETAAPGLVTCFSCDRSIEHGEHYYCVSRLVRQRGGDGHGEDRTLDSTASLQVCADCRLAAGRQPIAFSYAPLPLLRLEQEGFRRFAAERGRRGQPPEPVAPWDSRCTLCHGPVGPGETYVTIELSEETSCREGVETLQVHARLADLCHRCSGQYLVWLSMPEDDDRESK